MEIYKKSISLPSIGMFVPNEDDPEKGVWYDTRLRGWLTNFLTEAEYFTVRKRGDNVTLSPSDILATADSLVDILIEIYGVYPSEESAIEDNPPCPKIVLVHPDAEEFFELFTDIAGAIACLTGELPVITDIYVPICVTETIRDIGIYEEYLPDEGETEYDETEIPEGGDDVKEYAESQLHTLIRQRVSYDNDGNELPYFENDNNFELPFIVGAPCNVVYEGDVCYFNVLTGIRYKDPDGNDLSEADDKTYYDGSITEEGTIEFTYLVRCSMLIDADENERKYEGITYRETLKYSLENGSNGRKYIRLGESLTYPDNYDAEEGIRNYAEIIYGVRTDKDRLSLNPIIKREALMHIHDYDIDKDDVYIERGTSASYEAFNVLGEVNTIEDIERYRDDWFRIKGKND